MNQLGGKPPVERHNLSHKEMIPLVGQGRGKYLITAVGSRAALAVTKVLEEEEEEKKKRKEGGRWGGLNSEGRR